MAARVEATTIAVGPPQAGGASVIGDYLRGAMNCITLQRAAISGSALQSPRRSRDFYQNFYQARRAESTPADMGSLYSRGCGPEFNGDCTDVVSGHEASLPSWSCGFDSRHPLHV